MEFITNNTQPILIGAAIAIALCVFGLILVFSLSRKNGENKVKAYDLINNQIKEHKVSLVDYDRIDAFLKRNGAKYHYPFMAEPLKFILISICAGAVGVTVLGSFFGVLVGLLAMIVGFAGPYYLIKSANKKDNEIILEDIKMLYSALYNQLKAGIYVTDALLECSSGAGISRMIKNKRLLGELQKLSGDIAVTSDVAESLSKFEENFDNMYVSSLSVVINQAMESGYATEALADITEQLKEVEKNILFLKKEKKQMRNLFFELLFLAGIVITIFVFIFPEITKIMTIF